MIVLDANILIRAILGRRVRKFLEESGGAGVRFYAPDVAFNDLAEYLPSLLAKRGASAVDVEASIAYLGELVLRVDRDTYATFEGEARERLRGRDEEDWPILATALALGCPIWTEDTDFFGAGVAVWTTSRIGIFLKVQR